ncbi:MAG: hypothetical protein AB4057_08605 [Crocosphaera sp.]
MTEEYSNPKYELHELSNREKSELFSTKGNGLVSRVPDEEITRLVQLAEEVKNGCEIYFEKLEKLIFYRDILIFSGFILLMIFFANFLISIDSIYYIVFVFPVISFVILVYTRLINRRINGIQSKLDFEQNILIELVDLLRESGIFMSQQDNWTKFQEIEFKIRLSRFNVGKYKISKSFIEELFFKN